MIRLSGLHMLVEQQVGSLGHLRMRLPQQRVVLPEDEVLLDLLQQLHVLNLSYEAAPHRVLDQPSCRRPCYASSNMGLADPCLAV
jgi:hypothetical protein